MGYDVKVTVESIEGKCDAGFKVGDQFFIKNQGYMYLEKAGGICIELLGSIIPHCMAYSTGGKFPWEDQNGRILVSCPDRANLLTVSLSRVDEV